MSISHTLDFPAVVFDIGSGLCKAGLSCDDMPKCVIDSVIGQPTPKFGLLGSNRKQFYVGAEAQAYRGILELTYPIEHGIVKSWPDMEKIWHHLYNCELHIPSNDRPVLLSEPPRNPINNREKMAEVMFESFNVPAMYVALQPDLSLYASGRTSGLVMDIGEGVTSTFPIYEGSHLPHAGSRLNVAGQDITDYFMRLLMETGVYLHSSAEKEIAKEMKEKLCYVALDVEEEMQKVKKGSPVEYTLPDGKVITVGHQRFRAPEALFSPSSNGVEAPGMHTMIVDSILGCDIDIRRSLYSNILLSGGSTLFPGLEDRLYNEIRALAPDTVKVKIIAPKDRNFAVWIGGSILTCLESFRDKWVTSKDYEEFGSAVVHRNYF